jgi:hypothetical protein
MKKNTLSPASNYYGQTENSYETINVQGTTADTGMSPSYFRSFAVLSIVAHLNRIKYKENINNFVVNKFCVWLAKLRHV